MEAEISLRGIVYDKYKSISKLADAIGWSRQKTSNIINGVVEPSLSDTDKLSKALGMPFEKTARFFLS